MRTYLLYFLLVLFLTGCVVGRKASYRNMQVDMPSGLDKSLALATWDQRKQVLDGSQNEEFVGYMRSGVGIAYPVGTASGKDFAQVISEKISESFEDGKANVEIIQLQPLYSKDQVMEKLHSSEGDRLVLLKCNELHSDGYSQQTLNYDIDLTVYNAQRESLASKNFSGDRFISAQKMSVNEILEEDMPRTLNELIEEMFNDSTVQSALN